MSDQPTWPPQQNGHYPPVAQQQPLPPTKSKASTWVLIGCLGVIVLCALAITALLLVGREMEKSLEYPTAPTPSISASASAPGQKPAATVASDAPITQSARMVESDCFTFQLPQEYELKAPPSAGCQATINIKQSDSLTSVRVMIQTGSATVEQAEKEIAAALKDQKSIEIVSQKTIATAKGLTAIELKVISSGLSQRMYVIPGEGRTWNVGGRLAQSIVVMGYDLDVDPSPVQDVVDSLAFAP